MKMNAGVEMNVGVEPNVGVEMNATATFDQRTTCVCVSAELRGGDERDRRPDV